jgi:hypothetical protein
VLDNKYNDISNSIFLAAKGLFRAMLEDGVPIQQVQATAMSLQENIAQASQMAAAATVSKPMPPPMGLGSMFGMAPDEPPADDANPFEDQP